MAESNPVPSSPEAGASAGKDVLSTVHLYYSDTELFSNTARVIAVYDAEGKNGKQLVLVTDQTVMHPQGGTTVPHSSIRER